MSNTTSHTGRVGIAVATVLALSPLGVASASQSATGGAEGRARVVARVDVTGDHKPDTVRFTKVTKHRFRVTVRSSTGSTYRKVVRAPRISYGGWHDAARFDGHAGQELFLLTNGGAHSSMYTVLTFRRGRLVREKSPVHGRWLTDGAALSAAGWKRFRRNGQVRLRYTSVYSTRSPVWRGHQRQLRWKGNGWHALPAHKLRFRGDKRGHRIGGWHVRGLARW